MSVVDRRCVNGPPIFAFIVGYVRGVPQVVANVRPDSGLFDVRETEEVLSSTYREARAPSNRTLQNPTDAVVLVGV